LKGVADDCGGRGPYIWVLNDIWVLNAILVLLYWLRRTYSLWISGSAETGIGFILIEIAVRRNTAAEASEGRGLLRVAPVASATSF
jgi:hypothetical protein